MRPICFTYKVTIFALCCMIMAASTVARGAVIAYRSIPDIVAESDLIVMALVASIEAPRGAFDGRITLIPLEILKGPTVGSPIVLSFKGIGPGRSGSANGRQVLAFAKRAVNTSEFILLPLVQGGDTVLEQQLLSTTASPARGAIELKAEDTPLQKVIKALVTIQLHSNSANTLPYLMPLAWGRTEPELTAEAFRILQRSSWPGGRINGTIGLVALGDIDGLKSLEALEIQGHRDLPRVVSEVERFYRSPAPEGIVILSRWLRSGDPAKRHAAAGALARIHTPEAIMSLGPLLDDIDFEVRWRSIGGLSMFANNVPIGGAGPASGDWAFRSAETARFSVFDRNVVRQNERPYLEFWRRWWSDNQTAIGKLTVAPGR